MTFSFHFNGNNLKFPNIKQNENIKEYVGGDIQNFMSKLPGFIWSKYPGEHHLPTYNYLGPNTRLDIRLDENDKPKQGEEPINPIDDLAYHHDLAYRSKDINARHKADQEMIDGLNRLQNLSIPQRIIRAFIIKIFQAKMKLERQGQGINSRLQYAKEIHHQFKKPKYLRTINFKSKDNIWNADLVIMPNDGGYKYILTILDGFTRYAFCVPLKDKKGLTVYNAFQKVINDSKRTPDKLWVDQGKEFYNEHMYKLFKYKKSDVLDKLDDEYKNKIYSVFNSSKNPIIERFNRTLTNKLWMYFTINKSQKWVNLLPKVVNEYNNSIHSTIQTTPKIASINPSLVKISEQVYPGTETPKFKINDRVRIFKYKNKFEKGYKGYYTDEIFKVSQVLKTNPIMYKIQDLNDETIHGSFYSNELLKTVF